MPLTRRRRADQRMTGQTHTINRFSSETSSRRIPLHRRRRSSGFSLVEVLVAIAVLTIGIIAFLQIFPAGIAALKVAASVSEADRIAQSQLNQISPGSGAEIQQVAAVESIYNDSDGNMVQLDPNFNPDQALSPSAGLADDGSGTAPANLSTGFNIAASANGTGNGIVNPEPYEYISGERVSIPAPPMGVSSSNAMLSFGPLVLPAASGNAYVYPDLGKFNSLDPSSHCSFFVHGLPWVSHPGTSSPLTGAPGQQSGTTLAAGTVAVDDPNSELKQNSPEFLVDDANCAIALRNPSPNAPYNQAFIFQVSVLSVNNPTPVTHTFLFTADWPGATNTTTSTAIQFYDSNNNPRWVSLLNYTNGDPGTALADNQSNSLQAGDTFVPGTEKLVRDFNKVSAFDNDPYEFMFGTNSLALPSNATETDELGDLDFNPLAGQVVDTRGQPLQASVDYIVQSWHTIHEDRTIGDQANTGSGSNSSTTVRLTLKNLLKGGAQDTNGITYNGIANAGTPDDIIVYNLDNFSVINELTLSQVQGANPNGFYPDYANGALTFYNIATGTHIRVFYHAEDNWGVAILKPAASYTITTYTGSGLPSAPATTGEAVFDTTTGVLYFPICDVGRTVQIGGTLQYIDSNNNSQTVPLSLLTTLAASSAATATNPSINLTNAVSGGLPTGITYTGASPTASGASLTARAIWLQTRGVWRSRDVTTVDLPTGS